jgi:putative transferase (TIGR04331 family)
MILLTTKLDSNESFPDESIYLGEWAKVEGHTSSKTVPYHWDDRIKMEKDFIYLEELSERLLPSLGYCLNELHSVDISSDEWKKLLGLWLNYFLAATYDRYEMISYAADKYNFEMFNFNVPLEQIVPRATNDFVKLCTGDFWNSFIFTYFYRKLTGKNCIEKSIPITVQPIKEKSWKDTLSKFPKFFVECVANFFFSENQNQFLELGFPKSLSNFLNFSASGYSIPIRSLSVSDPHFDLSLREWDLKYFECSTDFELNLVGILPKHIPKFFVEEFQINFKAIARYADKLPKKNVFTSAHHLGNDTFNLFLIRSRSKLFSIQHGGEASWAFNGTYSYQKKTSDFHLVWGQEDDQRTMTVGITKTYGKKAYKYNDQTTAFIVCLDMPRYAFDLRSMPIGCQILEYFRNQKIFYSNLSPELQLKLRVKLYPVDYGWLSEHNLRNFYPDSIKESSGDLINSFYNHKLFIGTYNATTYLEALAINIPTILFWDKNIWTLNKESIPYFALLEEAGVFYESPYAAAKAIEEIWDDVNGWWDSPKVQSAVNIFKDKFVRPVNKPHKVFKNAVLQLKECETLIDGN